MDEKKLLNAFSNMPGREFNIDENQENVITHENGPLWVIAGPGSGKTDSIVLRCIKLLVVDEIRPAGIILTTFTEKAANNLQDRISQYMQYLINIDPSLSQIDYTRVRIGTLHGLCNDIMQEFRFTGYQNFRLLDDLEQRLFIMEHSNAAGITPNEYSSYESIWKEFPEVFEGYDAVTGARWSNGSVYPPNRYARSRGLLSLFNRMVEELVDVDHMRTEGGGWEMLAKAYDQYRERLFDNFRCDFSHVQLKFLEFLNDPQSGLFLNGNNTDQYPGVQYVLVDEYQDTNHIQEQIYFRLADNERNLCVVGDDDQAIYRFRGGTVECMVNFENVCHARWDNVNVKSVFLSVNYRSHSEIVSFYDAFIKSFPTMHKNGVRVKNKPKLSPGSTIDGSYPVVVIHRERTLDELGTYLADLVDGLLSNGTIADYSQCVLLLPSTRRTRQNAGPFMDALEDKGIPCYNPRSRSLLEEEEVVTVLGGFLEIIDPDRRAQRALRFDKIKQLADNWRDTFRNVASLNPDLGNYVSTYANRIKVKSPRVSVGFNLLEVFYHVLNFKPLSDWIEDPNRAARLGVVSKVLDAYSNVPSSNNPNRMLGFLYTSGIANHGVSFAWRKNFYYSLMGLLTAEGVNEAEDEIENYPKGHVPIMTIHQSKGLEFPIVLVSGLSDRNRDYASISIENKFSKFSNRSNIDNSSIEERALQDKIRFYYVAYSRAQYAIMLLSRISEYRRPGVGYGGSPSWSVFGHAKEI